MPVETKQQSLPLFDLAEARKARDAGVNAVQESADRFWLDMARGAVRMVAADAATFTTDAIWKRLGSLERPRDPRAMGAVMRWAQRSGLCEPSGDFAPSASVINHGRPLRVWRSLIWKGPGV